MRKQKIMSPEELDVIYQLEQAARRVHKAHEERLGSLHACTKSVLAIAQEAQRIREAQESGLRPDRTAKPIRTKISKRLSRGKKK